MSGAYILKNKEAGEKQIHLRDPFVLPFDNKYYLYGSRGEEAFGECTGLDVYISEDLQNWSGPKEVFTPPEWNCLDGTLYIDDDQVPYMIYCKEWLQEPLPDIVGQICAIRLTEDLKQAVGEEIYLFKANDPVWVNPMS